MNVYHPNHVYIPIVQVGMPNSVLRQKRKLHSISCLACANAQCVAYVSSLN